MAEAAAAALTSEAAGSKRDQQKIDPITAVQEEIGTLQLICVLSSFIHKGRSSVY